MSVSFRAMSLADIPMVMSVELDAYPFPWSVGNFVDCLKSNYHMPVACIDGNIVGYAVLSAMAGEAHVLNLCVSPRQQKKGIGSLLLDNLLQFAAAQRVEMVFLEVRRSNVVARRRYEEVGFVEIGVRRGYYPDHHGSEDAIVLARQLVLEPELGAEG